MIARRQVLLKAFKLFDLVVMVACFGFASWTSYLRGNGLKSFEQFLAMRIKIINFILFIGLILLWHVILNSFRLYQSKRLSSRWNEFFGIVKATTLGILLIFAAGKIFTIEIVTASFLAVFWISNLLLMIVSRLVLRSGLAWIRRRGRSRKLSSSTATPSLTTV